MPPPKQPWRPLLPMQIDQIKLMLGPAKLVHYTTVWRLIESLEAARRQLFAAGIDFMAAAEPPGVTTQTETVTVLAAEPCRGVNCGHSTPMALCWVCDDCGEIVEAKTWGASSPSKS